MKEDLEQLLIDLEEYFDCREDADYDYESQKYIPCEEMTLLSRIRELQKQLNAHESPY